MLFIVGSGSIEKAEATELYEEMHTMRNAVNGIMTQKLLGDYDDDWLANYYNEAVEGNNGWYIVRATDEIDDNPGEVDLSDKYELEYIRRTYMVNFETGEVMLSNPIKILGTSIRTYESIRDLVESDKI